MSEKKSHFRLGLFVVLSMGIAAAVLFVLGGRQLFQPTFTFETYFNESVAGLELGAPVKFRGVPLGKVTEITTSGSTYETDVPIAQRKGYIVVRAEFRGTRDQVKFYRKDLNEFVKAGVRAKTQLAGITGQQYLALDYVEPKDFRDLKFDWTPEYPYIPSAPSTSGIIIARVQAFLASLNEADVATLGKNLNTLLVTANAKLDALDVQALSKDADEALKEVRATIVRLDAILAKAPIDEAVRNIASAADHADTLFADPKIRETVANLEVLTGRLRKLAEAGEFDRIVKNLDQTIARLDAMIGDNQYDVRLIVQDLRTTAANLRVLSETIKRNPAGALLSGPPEKIEHQDKESK